MKAAAFKTMGPADEVLEIMELDQPTPTHGEVLVRLNCSAVNPSDVKKRNGAFPELLKMDLLFLIVMELGLLKRLDVVFRHQELVSEYGSMKLSMVDVLVPLRNMSRSIRIVQFGYPTMLILRWVPAWVYRQ